MSHLSPARSSDPPDFFCGLHDFLKTPMFLSLCGEMAKKQRFSCNFGTAFLRNATMYDFLQYCEVVAARLLYPHLEAQVLTIFFAASRGDYIDPVFLRSGFESKIFAKFEPTIE